MFKKLFLKSVITLSALITSTTLVFAQSIPFSIHPSYTHQGNKNWIILDLPPSANFSDFVTIKNTSDEAIKLNLQFHEAKDTPDGFQIEESTNYQNLGNWVKVTQSEIDLNPNEEKKVEVKIQIPADAETQKYTGVLLARYQNPKKDGPFNIVTRLGTRFYIEVNPNAEFKTSILEDTLTLDKYLLGLLSIISLIILGKIIIKRPQN